MLGYSISCVVSVRLDLLCGCAGSNPAKDHSAVRLDFFEGVSTRMTTDEIFFIRGPVSEVIILS